MKLNDALADGLHAIPGCRSLCYIDMPSRLVLGAKSHRSQPQEFYDACARQAGLLFRGQGMAGLQSQARARSSVSIFTRTGLRMFVRPGNDVDHALCYHMDLPDDADEIFAAVEENRAHVAAAF